jgi:hypothetical protein
MGCLSSRSAHPASGEETINPREASARNRCDARPPRRPHAVCFVLRELATRSRRSSSRGVIASGEGCKCTVDSAPRGRPTSTPLPLTSIPGLLPTAGGWARQGERLRVAAEFLCRLHFFVWMAALDSLHRLELQALASKSRSHRSSHPLSVAQAFAFGHWGGWGYQCVGSSRTQQ